MIIADTKVGGGNPPYIVAEMSCNHCGSFENAKKIIKAAKWAGADAVKTQCYEADTITLDCQTPDFIVQDGLWRGRRLYDLYKKAQTPFSWHKDLYALAADEGIAIFSSVFDKSSVDLCDRLGAVAFKIASFEIVDTPLISYAAQTGKPIIISTGMAAVEEIEEADAAAGKGKAAFLYCTSEYPGTVETASLNGIYNLQYFLHTNVIGISDHTIGSMVPIIATAMNANIIEKHLRLAGVVGSEDDSFSSDEYQFKHMVDDVKTAWEAIQIRIATEPNPSRQLRRSLYTRKDIKAGELFSEENIASVRPGYGAHPGQIKRFLGKVAKRDYRRGERLAWKS